MRPFKINVVVVGLLMALNAEAVHASQASDNAAVLGVVARALCSTGESGNVVLDSRAAYASPMLEGKFKQIGLDQEFAGLLLNKDRGAVIPSGGAYDCLRITAGSKVEAAFGPKGDAANEGHRWSAFQTAFPGAKGYAALSLPAFSVSGDSAAVYVLYSCGLTCGKGRVYLVRRTDRGWALTKELPLWDF